ncbi:MAG: hypothetical protein E6H10_15355 [Bacteroidetes bacterium]|nr:MAG: hypothetical protein E6H10_15355 [Bacteroidota bacterium]
MKLSWHSLRVSVAGARLSHLVQEDKIWDHGTMVEQVKNVFYKIEKAKQNGTLEAVKKYLGDKAYEQVMRVMKNTRSSSVFKNANVTEVSVNEVKQKNNKGPDRFTASIKGKRKTDEYAESISARGQQGIQNFSERWLFVRDGDWWMLAEMKK